MRGAGTSYGDPAEWADLVHRAVHDDADAWRTLVERLERVVWKAVNMMTADADIRDDAFAATWLRLAERLHTVREPHKLPGWVSTTAANEVRTLIRQRNRQGVPVSGPARSADHTADFGDVLGLLVDDRAEPGLDLIAAEQRREVRSAFARLDAGCREVLTVLVVADLPYGEASTRLGRPVGALGPTRRRCLEKLRNLLVEGSQSDA